MGKREHHFTQNLFNLNNISSFCYDEQSGGCRIRRSWRKIRKTPKVISFLFLIEIGALQRCRCPDVMWEMILRCWSSDPVDRPIFPEIFQIMDQHYGSFIQTKVTVYTPQAIRDIVSIIPCIVSLKCSLDLSK
jgi:hypothetical protein